MGTTAVLAAMLFAGGLRAAASAEDELRSAREAAVAGLAPREKRLAYLLYSGKGAPLLDQDHPADLAPGDWGRIGGQVEISQVVDGENFLAAGHGLWVSGVSTKGLADGQVIWLGERFFEVRGVRKYAAAGGFERSVKSVAVVDLGRGLRAAEELNRLRPFRVWRGPTERPLAAAKLDGFREGVVRLERLDGKSLWVRMGDLSKLDQTYVRAAVKRDGR